MITDKKPNLWLEHGAFFQANTIKGARYLDDCGKIMNEYSDNYADVSYTLNGLKLSKPNTQSMPEQIDVNTTNIHIACYGDDCIEKMVKTAAQITKKISETMGVESYSRLGFRVNYYKQIPELDRYLSKLGSKIIAPDFHALFMPTGQISEAALLTKSITKPFTVRFSFNPVIVEHPSSEKYGFSENGMVIDIDIGESKDSSERVLKTSHLGAFLKEAADCIRKKAEEAILSVRDIDE
jgi:hypothetical protein